MPKQTFALSPTAARRFLIHALALGSFQPLPDVSAALASLGAVQEDNINVCGRIHDLILWPRVQGYAPGHLETALYGSPRVAFEYYFANHAARNLHVLPIEDYPYFVRAMLSRRAVPDRWRGLLPEEEPVAAKVLARIDAEGPLRTRATGADDGHTTSGWGTRQTVASRVTEKLWLQGVLSVAKRENFERWFDRTERCLPAHAAALHADGAPLPTHDEEAAYLRRKQLQGRRLFRLKRSDVELLGDKAFVRVDVEGDRRTWHALAEDAALLAQAEDLPPASHALLLAPLEPLVYDRERTRSLFGFDYVWEVYTPQAKRKWGYYVLPILFGDRLVGRVDPKLDRKTGVLTLNSLTLEPDVDADEVAGPIAERLIAYAGFLGAARFAVPPRKAPRAIRESVLRWKALTPRPPLSQAREGE